MRLNTAYALIKLCFGENHTTNVIRSNHSNVYYILIDNRFVGSINPLENNDKNHQEFLEKVKEDILVHQGKILQ